MFKFGECWFTKCHNVAQLEGQRSGSWDKHIVSLCVYYGLEAQGYRKFKIGAILR